MDVSASLRCPLCRIDWWVVVTYLSRTVLLNEATEGVPYLMRRRPLTSPLLGLGVIPLDLAPWDIRAMGVGTPGPLA